MSPKAHTLKRKEVKESVKYSVYEGMAAAAAEGSTDDLYTPYALAAGASLSQVGWLITFQQLLASVCYVKLSNLSSVFGSRKRLILVLVLFDVITFLPFIILPYFIRDHLVLAVFFFFAIGALPGLIIGPVWASWITDLVPVGVRGRFFGKRATLTGASGLTCFIMAGLVLDHFKGIPSIPGFANFDGFAIVFSFAALCRMVSWLLYWRMSDIPIKQRESRVAFGISDFKEALGSGRFGHFMRYSALFYFAVNLSSPFVAAFMLQENGGLGFSYLQFMILLCSSEVSKLCVFRFWGKYADAAGHLRVVKLASCIIPFLPMLWFISHNFVYLICVQVLNGCVWAGFELCSPNFVYSALPANNRIKFIACYKAMNGAGIAMGALVGGYLATHLPPLFGYSLLTLFLVGGMARGLVAFKLLPSIVDVARKRSGMSPWAYKMWYTPVYRPSTDNAAWALLYAPMGQKMGNGLAINQNTGIELAVERHGLYYNRPYYPPPEPREEKKDANQKRVNSNFKMLRGSQAGPKPDTNDLVVTSASPDQKGMFYHKVWRGLKNLVNGGEEPPRNIPTESKKTPLLYNKTAWREFLPDNQDHVPGKSQARPKREATMFEKGDWPDPESKPQIGTEAVKKPGEGLLHKPGEWAETPPEAGTKENIPEGVLHKPSAWDRPAPPEPPKGRPQPDQKGAFYEPAKPEFRNAANPDPSALPPSHHADAMLHNPSSWATFSSKPEPKDTPLSFEGHVKHEALLHNKENWDRFVKDEKPVSNLEKKALPGVGPHREPLLLNKNMRDDSGRIAFQGTDSGFNPALPNQPHKEPLLHNRDEWDRFTGKKDKPEDIEKRGTLYHQPSTPPRPGESKPNTTAPPSKGLFHRPDAWKSKDKGGPGANRGNTPPGMPDYPRKARPPEDKRKK